jgi:hypothetical protein
MLLAWLCFVKPNVHSILSQKEAVLRSIIQKPEICEMFVSYIESTVLRWILLPKDLCLPDPFSLHILSI